MLNRVCVRTCTICLSHERLAMWGVDYWWYDCILEDRCVHTMCTCIETDRFEQCTLVGDIVDHASLGGGSSECYWWARRQLDIGCLIGIQ